MGRIVNDEALDTLFRAARSPDAWLAQPVGDTLLRAVWELVKLGPSSSVGAPACLLFVRSDEAKARLRAAVPAATHAAIAAAPIIAILGHALDPARRSAPRCDGALQAAYLILAARALGLDCTPIWDFDGEAVDAVFFPEETIAANFLCVLGHGDDTRRSPHEVRPGFDEACKIL